MKIIKKMQGVVSDIRTKRDVKVQAKLFAAENKLNNQKKFVKEFMEMYDCKQTMGKYVVKFTEPADEVNENVAVTMLGSLLNSILIISTNENPNYCYKAVETLGRICLDITLETGTPSEQFELMALMQKYSVVGDEEENDEEDLDG